MGMLGSLAGFEVDFFRWMAVGIPVSLGMYAALTALTHWLYPLRPDADS